MALTQRHSRGYQARAYIDVNGNVDIAKFYGSKLQDIMSEKFPEGTKMKRLGKGITDLTPAAAETVDTESDMLSAGFQSSEVSAKAITYAFTGNRYIGDPAQDYIFDKFSKLGNELKTIVVIIDPDGTVRIGAATITTPLGYSGAVNANSPVSFTLTIDGQPYVIHTDGSVECQIDSLTVSPEEPKAEVGATVQLVATIAPEYATNNAVDWSVQDETIATIGADGLLTGKTAGKTVVQVFAKSDESKVSMIPVEITAKSKV